jgi:chemotaxis methyl-accepting protein methylase
LDQDTLKQVLDIIRVRSHDDFRCYKRNTLIRRTQRRMGLRQIENMVDYIDILKKDSEETNALLKDMLIGVTGFFRERQVWETVRMKVISSLVGGMDSEESLRIWVPGCSTGEEAYTIAIQYAGHCRLTAYACQTGW